MDFEDRVFLIPCMPGMVFFALRRGYDAYPPSATWQVRKGDYAEEGSPLVTYLWPSVVAPFAGRIVVVGTVDHCMSGEWPNGDDFPGLSAGFASRFILFGIQPRRGVVTHDAVSRAYAPVIDVVRLIVQPKPRNLLKRILGIEGPVSDIAEAKQEILGAVATLAHARAKIAPAGVDPDNHFRPT